MNKKITLLSVLLIIFVLSCGGTDIDEMVKIASELYENPKITEMCDGTKSKKYINGNLVTYDINDTRQYTEYYKKVLIREGIDEKIYNHYKTRLSKSKARHYYRHHDFSVFITGGMMGDIEGYLVTHNNASVPSEGFRLTSYYYIRIEKKIKDNVYQIWGD